MKAIEEINRQATEADEAIAKAAEARLKQLGLKNTDEGIEKVRYKMMRDIRREEEER